MASLSPADSQRRPLENLDISEPEERVYSWLLNHPAASVAEVAKGLILTSGKAQRLLDSIRSKGLATHTPERPRRYIPSSPDVAIEALIQQRQKGLEDARLVAKKLQEKAEFGRKSSPHRIIELITSHTAMAQVFDLMTRSARDEVIGLIRPPLWVTRLDLSAEDDRPSQRESQARGVSYRSIISEEMLNCPGSMENIRADIQAGEEVRVAPFLPFKAVMVDRRMALIPLNLDDADSPSLLVRSSSLMDALYALFAFLWRNAVPMRVAGNELQHESVPAELSNETRELVSLMAVGLNDKTIAHDLHIPMRTLTRRIAELKRELEARTRFQAGWLAAMKSEQ
jgi:DNA-binding MarR family transcriptional regulator